MIELIKQNTTLELTTPGGTTVISGLENLHDGTNYGLWQETEKDDANIIYKFSDTQLTPEEKEEIKKQTFDRSQTGKTAVAFGSSAAIGDRSFAVGSSNMAAGGKSMALGCDNLTTGDMSAAIGYANLSVGTSSIALGSQNMAQGLASISTGLQTFAGGAYSFSAGNNTIANKSNQFVIGKFNKNKNNTVFEVGYGADNDNRANLFEVGLDWSQYQLGVYEPFIMLGNKKLTETALENIMGLEGQMESVLDELHNYAMALVGGAE